MQFLSFGVRKRGIPFCGRLKVLHSGPSRGTNNVVFQRFLDIFPKSGRLDLNQRSPHPQCGALPDYATARIEWQATSLICRLQNRNPGPGVRGNEKRQLRGATASREVFSQSSRCEFSPQGGDLGTVNTRAVKPGCQSDGSRASPRLGSEP